MVLFQTIAAARMLTPSGSVGQTHWGDSVSNNPSTTQSADAQLKVNIFIKTVFGMTLCNIYLLSVYLHFSTFFGV